MTEYFEYLREMLTAFFTDLGEFLGTAFVSPWKPVGGNFEQYQSIFNSHSPNFNFWSWFFYILFLIFFIGLIAAIIFGLYILLRKYIRFVKRELDKDELRNQVDRLNYELYQAIQEKDKILNLKTGYMGLKPDEGMASKEDQEVLEQVTSRFPKLTRVDQDYADANTQIMFKEGLSLEELCNRFRNYAASKLGLFYRIDQIRQLFAGLATSKLIILEGISGTGKTSLAYALGKFFSYKSEIIPVQPSWKDRSELLGYYNEFTKKFNESEFLRALYTTTYRKDMNIIVLDEMNLARIEYYFAEFLSVMEKRDEEDWIIDLIPSVDPSDPKHIKDGKLLIPQNVYFFGTANNDDSTFPIADKVYDRAISLFFDDKGRYFEAEPTEPISIPYAQLVSLFKDAKKQYGISPDMLRKFEELDNFVIKNFRLAFGNRILKQLDDFVPNFIACGGSESDAFDFIFSNKILKKFEALNIAYFKEEIKALDAYLEKVYGKGNFRMSHAYLENLLKNNA